MIEIIGEAGSSEYDAALKFKAVFLTLLGGNAENGEIKIVVSAKLYGEKRQDVDLIIIGSLRYPLLIPLSNTVTKEAKLLSFFLVVEVKDHSPERIDFRGNNVFVSYQSNQGMFSNASEQSHQQMSSAFNYINKNNFKPPFILNMLLLDNCPTDLLPIGRHNILGSDFSTQNFLENIYIAREDNLNDKNVLIQSFTQSRSACYTDIAQLFTRRISSSKLDRKKIELITQQSFDQKYANDLGKQLLIFSGPGGTGKTVKLLQLAHYVYDVLGKRALILTYNLSLVSDIRRLFTLIGIADDIASAQVKISSVHAFMHEILVATGIYDKNADNFFRRYEFLKSDLLANIEAVGKQDYEHWDFIFIDEGQDWPENERDIIYKLFKAQNTVVAIGKAQRVRTNSDCNWAGDWKNQKIPLSKSLRLKYDICKFSARFIEKLEIPDWRMEPDVSIYGGSVILLIGDVMNDMQAVVKIVEEAKAAKNSSVDLLFCVPPSMVTNSGEVGKISSISNKLHALGYKTWDGVDEETRHSYPTDLDQLRIVQYDSCRGLEGWTVLNLAFDELYDYKKKNYKPTEAESTDLFFNHDEFSERFARKWLAIPITRAIDTLVLNLKDPEHWLTKELLGISKDMSCVNVIYINQESSSLNE